MQVIFHQDFYQVYTSDPAAAAGRMEAIVQAIEGQYGFVTAQPASAADIAAVHTERHIRKVREKGLYDIAALAAGGAIQAATIGMSEPAFALIRPPGHHASSDSSWGFCYFNNMAIALEKLQKEKRIRSAFVLDFDLHYGDGNVNTLAKKGYVSLYNPEAYQRDRYLADVERKLADCRADIIGISAGFDNHEQDWGNVLKTEDYTKMGWMVAQCAQRNQGGCFALLEGGYNHEVLGENVRALLEGMAGG